MVVALQDLFRSVSVVNVYDEKKETNEPMSTMAMRRIKSGYVSRAYSAAIITLLNTQKPQLLAVVRRPSVPAWWPGGRMHAKAFRYSFDTTA